MSEHGIVVFEDGRVGRFDFLYWGQEGATGMTGKVTWLDKRCKKSVVKELFEEKVEPLCHVELLFESKNHVKGNGCTDWHFERGDFSRDALLNRILNIMRVKYPDKVYLRHEYEQKFIDNFGNEHPRYWQGEFPPVLGTYTVVMKIYMED